MTLHYGWKQASTQEKNVIEKLVGRLTLNGYKVHTVGSRKIKNGWSPIDSDFDFLVPVINKTEEHFVKGMLKRNGFEEGGSDVPQSSFSSYKRGNFNFIITWGDETQQFLAAQELVESLSIAGKADRIKVFDFLRGGTFTSFNGEEVPVVSEEDYEKVINKYSSSQG